MTMAKTRILVVEDEDNIRSALHQWFTLRGFDADQAQDGLEAIEKCKENQYGVITMDLEMPRMTGIEAIPIIHEMLPDAIIVVLTGYVQGTRDVSLTGVSEVLTKPTPLREIEKVIRRLTGETAH
ncbi:MAG: response regulator [Nitrospiraceae bacterium]|nr:response regulator [Nitrospiraceae bacterium]